MALLPPLDAYTLWLELELCEQETRLDGRRIWKARESFQIGARALLTPRKDAHEFTVADAGLMGASAKSLVTTWMRTGR